MIDQQAFAALLWQHVDGIEQPRAVASLREYCSSYTGRHFEDLVSTDEPNEITARDIVAVSTLSVTVPVKTAIWIMGEGRGEVAALLERIPESGGSATVHIWDEDADLSPEGPTWALWTLLRSQPGMGPTITSKLLAAKRPHLVPVQDRHVARALQLEDKVWELWKGALANPTGAELRTRAEELRSEAEANQNLSVLRIFDIIVWMRHHGGQPPWADPAVLGYSINDFG